MIPLEISALSPNGEGIARHGGMVHFVPRTLPGECCEVEVVQRTARWCRAHVRRWLVRVPARVSPPCPLYDACGGCQLQHMSYEQQCAFKRGAVMETLRRIGHIDIVPEEVVASPPTGYRNKVTFTVIRTETGLRLGLHRWDAPDALIPVPSCLQLEPELNACLPAIERWINAPGTSSLRDRCTRLVLRRLEHERIVVVVVPPKTLSSLRFDEIALPEGISALYVTEDRLAAPIHLLTQSSKGPRFPTAFGQTNAVIAATLYRTLATLPDDRCRMAVDAYAGTGELLVLLAERAERVTGIEINREAVSATRMRVAQAGLSERVRVRWGAAEKWLARALPASFVVLNPPRAGCGQRVLDTLVQRPPQQLAYVSCHPAALARDLRSLLDAGFQLERVVPFDMFPQTYHVEVLAVLRGPQ